MSQEPRNRYVTLAAPLPPGPIRAGHFSLRSGGVPAVQDGQLLLRPVAFSIDPALRGQLGDWRIGGLPTYRPGEPVGGHAVGRVVASRHTAFAEGDLVRAVMDWADYSLSPNPDDAGGPTPVDPAWGKPSHALGVFGTTGLTAFYGITEVAKPRPGETVLVSAAAGGVGSLAGQIAKLHGARVIGLAGTEAKRAAVTGTLGFDAALDYRAPDFEDHLRALMPGGPDVYFDNVGGPLSQTVMNLMRRPARVVECGQISTYDGDDVFTLDIRPVHFRGLRLEGFTVGLFREHDERALAQLLDWVRSGDIVALETESHGLESLPAAAEGIFRGRNTGKMIVTVP